MNKKTISIIVPAFNESECIEELSYRLIALFDSESNYNFECILVENGSTDDTYKKLLETRSKDHRFRILKLSRNFRTDGGLTAGLSVISGDACVFMAADLQDPPEFISHFLRKWEEGFDNVYGIVTKRRGTSYIRRLNSALFYLFASKLTKNRIPQNVSDFRLLDKKVYVAILSMDERNRFIRGLVAWTGFKSTGIEIPRPQRFAGKSKAYTFGIIDFAFKGIFAHSYIPLRIITISGLVTSFISLLTFVAFLVRWIYFGVPFSGFGTIVTLILFAIGFLTLIIGIIAEYLGLIYEEVKQRPNFIIEKFH
jgi:glycosyltransferase involved in cell wall biosynthesis